MAERRYRVLVSWSGGKPGKVLVVVEEEDGVPRVFGDYASWEAEKSLEELQASDLPVRIPQDAKVALLPARMAVGRTGLEAWENAQRARPDPADLEVLDREPVAA